jgi:centromere protein C
MVARREPTANNYSAVGKQGRSAQYYDSIKSIADSVQTHRSHSRPATSRQLWNGTYIRDFFFPAQTVPFKEHDRDGISRSRRYVLEFRDTLQPHAPFQRCCARMKAQDIKADRCADHAATPRAQSATRSVRSTPARPPRSLSPRKSGISGAARKSNGVDIFSIPNNGQDNSQRERSVSATTPRQELQALRPIENHSERSARTTKASSKAPPSPATPQFVRRPRNSIDMRQIEAQSTPSMGGDESDAYDEAALEVETAVRGDPDDQRFGDHTNITTPTPRQKQTAFEVGEPDLVFDDEAESEPEGETPQPPPSIQRNEANSRKKRKSDAMEDEPLESPKPVKELKRRGRPPIDKDNNPAVPSPNPVISDAMGKQPLRQKSTNLQLSSRQQEELDQIVEKVRARPGPPRSLYILRRETPADEGVTHTRSGRVSVKPLAYWRNERCVYGNSPSGAGLADGARFPLNSIKEIVRSEQVDSPIRKKTKRGRKNKHKSAKGKGKARTKDETGEGTEESYEHDEDHGHSSDSSFDLEEVRQDPLAEGWETETGTLRGNVAIWDNYQQAPTEMEEEVEIAHAPAAIKTREIKGTGSKEGPTFRYAKLLSTKFFGTGLVDLPPGGVKRPKNSRKMHMSFFVVKGRVTVTVGPLGGEETGSMNRFSIGKGGFWQVPRGECAASRNVQQRCAGR